MQQRRHHNLHILTDNQSLEYKARSSEQAELTLSQ